MIALIDEYKKELLSIANFAEETVQNYVSCILSFIEYCKSNLKIRPDKCRGKHILEWMTEIKKTGVSNSRLQHHRSALKTFFAFLYKTKIIRKNPTDAIPIIRKKRSDRNKPISEDTAFKLLKSIDQSTWIDRRNYVIISMFWTLGLRLSELRSLKVGSFEPYHGHRIGLLRVRGKNRKQRALFVVDKLYDILVAYLDDPQSPHKNNEPLFPVDKGGVISNDRVQRMIKEYCSKADIKNRITPHVLRHSFATEMYHNNVPVSAIQSMLGHSKKAETSIYIHVSDQLQRQALELISLSGELSWL
jgi:integrase/recombinase XerD